MNLAKFHGIEDSPAGDLVEKIMKNFRGGENLVFVNSHQYDALYKNIANVVKDSFERMGE